MQGAALQTQPPAVPGTSAQSINRESVITFADLRKLLLKRKWAILVCILIGVSVGVYHAKTATPQYEAVARVDVDLSRTDSAGLGEMMENKIESDTSERLQTELRIMQSDSVAMNVIDKLDLYRKPPFSEVFGKRGYQGVISPTQQAMLIRSFKLATQVTLIPETDLAEIHFKNQDPRVAQEAANEIVTAYQDWTLRSHFESMEHISDWLSQQMANLKQKVTTTQDQLVQFQRAHNMVSSGPDGGSLTDTDLQTVDGQLAEAKADRIVKEARYKMAQTRNPDLLVSVAPGTVLSSLRSQEAQLMVQKADLQSRFGPEYPKVKELNRQLTAVQADIDHEISTLTDRFKAEYDAAGQTEDLLQNRLSQVEQAAFNQSESAAQFQILKHNAESSSALYDALQLRLQEAGITAGLNSNSIEVVDRAAQPSTPVSPQKRLDVEYGFLGGLVVGMALALLLESLDDTLRTSEDVEHLISTPALSVVPRFNVATKKLKSYGGEKRPDELAQPQEARIIRDLPTIYEPQSLSAESFRTLRSAILLSAVDRDPKVILVTSGLAAEGKSTCAANTAVAFAQRPARVLLVDTDLRKGTLHLKFKVSNRTGLSTYLSHASGEESFVTPIPSLPNLCVLPRGPIAPNPGEMLSSVSMAEAIERWRREWDFVILDSSPILAVSDTLSIVQQVDGALIIVRAGVTRKKALQKTREQLRRANARILGSVVNGVDMRLENYYTYSRGYSYGYRNGYQSAYGSGYGATEEDHES